MANAGCVNAYDCDGCYLATLENLSSDNIGTYINITVPSEYGRRQIDYIKYTDKCGCTCCLTGENELRIYATQGVIKNFTLTNDEDNEVVNVKWNDLFGSNRAKTIVRYKTGSYPTSISDGTLAVEEVIQNQYSVSGYNISGLTNGMTYYFTAFAVSQDNTIIVMQQANIEVEFFPTEYQRVEYIESTGTQRIDTGYIPKSNTDFEVKFRNISNINTYRTILGTRYDTSNNAYRIGYMNGKSYYELSPANTEISDATIGWFNTGVDYLLEFKNKKLTNNGNVVNSAVNFTQNATYTLYLFDGHAYNKSNPFEASASRIYYCKLWEGGTLVRDFIPCYRKSDGVIGMYDRVGKTFYANIGTGTFLKGVDIINNFNSAYQRVEYIESTGTQYINSGVLPSQNTEISADILRGSSQIEWAVFWGVTGNDSSSDGVLGRLYYSSSTGNVNTINIWFCNSTYGEFNRSLGTNNFHQIISKKNGGYTNGTSYTLTTSGTPYQGNIFIFCGNNGGTAWRFSRCQIRSFIISSNGNIQRKLYPCYRKSDNVIGMLDIENGTFYTNAGTGTFTKGPNVN